MKMLKPNKHYQNLKDSYLFYNIAQKTNAYQAAHPDQKMLRLGDWRCDLAPLRCCHSGFTPGG